MAATAPTPASRRPLLRADSRRRPQSRGPPGGRATGARRASPGRRSAAAPARRPSRLERRARSRATGPQARRRRRTECEADGRAGLRGRSATIRSGTVAMADPRSAPRASRAAPPLVTGGYASRHLARYRHLQCPRRYEHDREEAEQRRERAVLLAAEDAPGREQEDVGRDDRHGGRDGEQRAAARTTPRRAGLLARITGFCGMRTASAGDRTCYERTRRRLRLCMSS